MAMLGGMLANPKACGRVFQHIDSSDALALAEHRVIFDAIRAMHFAGRRADHVTIKPFLGGKLDEFGGIGYIDKVVACAVTPINAGEYARMVAELFVRREHIAVADQLHEWSYNADLDRPAPDEALEKLDGLRYRRLGGHIDGLEKYRFGKLHLLKEPPVEPILGGWLHRQSRCFVSGAKKTGKSFLLMAIMHAVSIGADLLHWKGSGKPTPVLYVDGELGVVEFQRREADYRERFGHGEFGDAYVLHFDKYPLAPIDTSAGQQQIINAADQVKAGLVIIDNWTALTDSDLNEATAIKAIRPLINELMTRRVASICGVHAGHDVTRAAGSYAIGALTTATIHLTRDEDIPANLCRGVLTWQDTRSADPEDPDYRDVAYEVQRGILVEAGDGGPVRKRQPKADDARWALEQLSQCLMNEGVTLHANATRPANMSAVTVQQFKRWLERRGEHTEIERARMVKDLLHGGFIAKDADYIWRC